ncbi:hypothetical protein FA13DRAFT_1604589, partial [Coprinellus micaceus]
KMANSLAGKVEIGGPMAAMYLLGNPDHYSSHSFVSLYWRSFVLYVMREWSDSEETHNDQGEDEDTVMLERGYGRILSKSSVDDYVMRPVELSGVCLYDWTQCSSRRSVKGLKKYPVDLLFYAEGHPLRETHMVKYDVNLVKTVVPNLLGGYIPKKDGEDPEFYCCTMLTLFSPWRTGLELRGPDETWQAAYNRQSFSDRHRCIINNINIRYECYDSRDDYHHRMRMRAAELRDEYDSDIEGDTPDDDLPDLDSDLQDSVEADDCRGVWSRGKMDQMKEVETVLHSAGWSEGASQGLSDSPPNTFTPERSLSAKGWKDLLSEHKKKVIDSR